MRRNSHHIGLSTVEGRQQHSMEGTNQGDPANMEIVTQASVTNELAGLLQQPQPDSNSPDTTINEIPLKSKHDPMEIMTKHISFRLSNEFSPVDDPSADTAIYIGVPASIPGQDSREYDHVCKHFNKIHLLNSSTLKALGSAKLENLLRPNPCIRAEKKFKKLDAYNKLSPAVKAQIKYHINLTPSQDDDEAALLVMSLSCSSGVLRWHLASELYHLDPSTVAGVDHFDTARNPYYMDLLRALEGPPEIKLPIADEYCPVRHHSAIERVLHAIQGNDPKLDSAPKVWTYFAVAENLGCVKNLSISLWLWLWFEKNPQFVQNNPEIAYRIGMACQWRDFTRDAFSILVGEKALADAYGQLVEKVASSSTSIHGRPLEILDDDELSRVGHAASSLIARIHTAIHSLGLLLDWLPRSTEFQKLLNLEPKNDAQATMILNARNAIEALVRRRVLEFLVLELTEVHEELHQVNPGSPMPHTKYQISFRRTYNDLPYRARIFTRSFWLGLCQTDFNQSKADAYFSRASIWGVDDTSFNNDPILSQVDFSSSNDMNKVARAVQEVNDIIRIANSATETKGMQFTLQGPYHVKSASNGKRPAFDLPAEDSVSTTAGILEYTDIEPVLGEDQTKETDDFAGDMKRRKTLENSNGKVSLPWRLMPGRKVDDEIPASDEATSATEASSQEKESLARRLNKMSLQAMLARYPTDKVRDLKLRGFSAQQILEALGAERESNEQTKVWDDTDPFFEGDCWTRAEDSLTSQVVSDPSTKSAPLNEDSFPDPPRHLRVTNPDPDTATKEQSSPSGPRGRIMQQFSDIPPPSSSIRGVHNQPFTSPRAAQSTPATLESKLISTTNMFSEFQKIIRMTAQEIVYPNHLFHGRGAIPINLIDFVIALTDEEFKFLPLWADGCDDGTGGVFESAVPNLEGEGGFRGGKRGMGRANATGLEGAESVSSRDSEFEDISSADALSSTARASRKATDGTQTVKSYDGDMMSETSSEAGFMKQDEIYDLIREMKTDQAVKDAAAGEGGAAAVEDGDVSTIMGAGSDRGEDIQGQFFGGDDGDDNDDSSPSGDEAENEAGFEDDDDFLGAAVIDKVPARGGDDDFDDENMEIIDKNVL